MQIILDVSAVLKVPVFPSVGLLKIDQYLLYQSADQNHDEPLSAWIKWILLSSDTWFSGLVCLASANIPELSKGISFKSCLYLQYITYTICRYSMIM